jgi:putative redox protein
MTGPTEPAEGTALATKAGEGTFQIRVESGGYAFQMDEPMSDGGLATGPNPFDLLRASLASCTLMTLQAYAKLKGWTFEDLKLHVTHQKGANGARDRFDRVIETSNATDEQRERLLKIALRCPVHLLLEAGADVTVAMAD